MTFRIVPDGAEPVSPEGFNGHASQRWRAAREHLLETNRVAAQLLAIMNRRSVGAGELVLADRYVRDPQDHIPRSASILAGVRTEQRQLSTPAPESAPVAGRLCLIVGDGLLKVAGPSLAPGGVAAPGGLIERYRT